MSTRVRANKAGPLPEWKVGDFLLLKGEGWREGSEIYVARVVSEGVEIMWVLSDTPVKPEFKWASFSSDSAWQVEVVGRGDEVSKEG